MNSLSKFIRIIKQNLSDELDKNPNLNIKDYTQIFFEYFHLNNAFQYLKTQSVTSDSMYLSIHLRPFESKIYMERDLYFEDSDDEFQIQFELILDIPPVEIIVSETFEINRDYNGDFWNDEDGYLYFEDFKENVISSGYILDFLHLQPKSVRIGMNSNHI